MAETTKVMKGGFRATLALIISIIALAVSILAYSGSEGKEELNARIKDLRATVDKMKEESADQLSKMRNETAQALEKLSQAVKQDEGSKN